ncbi:MAG: DUF92 domain-containing protein [Chloroflexaceae bacterium]
MIDTTRFILGVAISTGIGGLAYWRQSLTAGGWLGAIIVGTLTFGAGGWVWGLTLFAFFISSSLLSHYREEVKEQRAAEKFSKGGRRDLRQALANGGVGALLALLYGLFGEPLLLFAAFVGVMATVTADTWATESGVLSPHQPRLITTGRRVEPGTSGGITLLGTGAAAAGGGFIGLAILGFMIIGQMLVGQPVTVAGWLLPAALLGGLVGALFDSLLGATVQAMYRYPGGKETERPVGRDGTPNAFVRGWRWLDNDLVNLLSSLVGGLVAAIVAGLLA